jgi:hypothetical protein
VTLDNLTSLINGQLLSDVTITSFNAITDKASRVQRGDLFVCVDQDNNSVDEALQNGAYGIVFDKITPKLDNETAWIRVEDCFEAHLKLLRFHLMPKNIEVYYTDIYTLEYIQMLQLGQECKVISDTISTVTNKLWNLEASQKLILKDQSEIKTLFPMAIEIDLLGDISFESVTPYESNLSIEGLHYKRLRIPQVLHRSFNKAWSFLNENHIPLKFETLALPRSFSLNFCDTQLNIKEFGKGSFTLFFSDDLEMIKAFDKSLSELSPWIKIKHFFNKKHKDLSYNQSTIFSDRENLIHLLKDERFDVAIIMGEHSDMLHELPTPSQPNLFQLEF